jgi:hypothetical protein
MALITVNGQDVIEARATRRRVGAWRWDILVDDPTALAGKVTIDVNSGALTFLGSVARAGVFSDTGHVQVLAGAAGLSTPGTPRHYNGTSVGIVLADILSDADEALSPTADSSVLGAGLDAWTTASVPVATLISLVLAAGAPGAVWRSLPDGTIWVGNETWPDSGADPATYQIFEDAAESNSMLVGCDAPFLLPGTTFEGRQVGYVEDSVGQEGAGVTCRILFEDPTSITGVDRMRKALFALAARAASQTDAIDYSRRYPATVISQAGSAIDVQPELVNGQALLDSMGNVPLWLGVPGASVNGITGGRVMVGWSGGDPSKPYATLFDADTTLPPGSSLVIAGGAQGAARLGDTVTLTMLPSDLVALASAMLATGAFTPSGVGPNPPPAALPFVDGQITSGSSIVKVGG